jgi:hypothetical protein
MISNAVRQLFETAFIVSLLTEKSIKTDYNEPKRSLSL